MYQSVAIVLIYQFFNNKHYFYEYFILELRRKVDRDYNNVLKKKQEEEKTYRLVSFYFLYCFLKI